MGSKKRIKHNVKKVNFLKKKTHKATQEFGPKINAVHHESNIILKNINLKNNLKIKLLLHFYNSFNLISAQRQNLLKKEKKLTNYLTTVKKKKYYDQISQLKKTKKLKAKNFRFKYLCFLLMFKTLFNITAENEWQTLFLLTSNKQQYFLNTLGINFFLFKTYSSGRCLKKEFGAKTSKGLKKSFKLNKALVEYYFLSALTKTVTTKFTHTYIKPFNKKALILYNQIQANSDYYFTHLGFHKYYKINFKRVTRIKKKIKKKLISENFLAKTT